MFRPFLVVTLVLLSGCVGLQPPRGSESTREYLQTSEVPYQEAYRIIAKQVRACYRVIGVFGNGYDVQADLDSAARLGRIEVYHVGLSGASKSEDSMMSRTVTVVATETGSSIRTEGMTPRYVYTTHQAIHGWLNGRDGCNP
jgi:hypothetical protein